MMQKVIPNMAGSTRSFTGALAALLLLTGCPYDSKVGLNAYEESLKLNKAFYGEWSCRSEDGSRDDLRIERGMKQVYNVRHTHYGADGKKEDYQYYRAFITDIDGAQIVNLEKKDGFFNFYKYELHDNDELSVMAVGEDYMKSHYENFDEPDTESLRNFIRENINEAAMYEAPMRFSRNK